MSAYHHCCRHFEYMLPDEFDATLDNLFWCHWSRKLIKQGNTLVINPVWGLRKKPDRKDIPPYILRAASADIVNPIIKAIGPSLLHIYACHGSWEPEYWNQRDKDGAYIIGPPPSWLTDKRTNIIYHPSASGFVVKKGSQT